MPSGSQMRFKVLPLRISWQMRSPIALVNLVGRPNRFAIYYKYTTYGDWHVSRGETVQGEELPPGCDAAICQFESVNGLLSFARLRISDGDPVTCSVCRDALDSRDCPMISR